MNWKQDIEIKLQARFFDSVLHSADDHLESSIMWELALTATRAHLSHVGNHFPNAVFLPTGFVCLVIRNNGQLSLLLEHFSDWEVESGIVC